MSDTYLKAATIATDLVMKASIEDIILGFTKIFAATLIPMTDDEFFEATNRALQETLGLSEEKMFEISHEVNA